MKLNCATFEKCFDKEFHLPENTANARKGKLFSQDMGSNMKSKKSAIPGNHSTSSLVILFSDDSVDSHSNDSLDKLAEKGNVET